MLIEKNGVKKEVSAKKPLDRLLKSGWTEVKEKTEKKSK
jgi:hypothetical protein